jgi:hypothetical protein
MDSENKFWIWMWGYLLAFVLALIFAVTYTMAGKRLMMSEMVSNGADPMKVACALNMHDDKTICVIYGVKGEMK